MVFAFSQEMIPLESPERELAGRKAGRKGQRAAELERDAQWWSRVRFLTVAGPILLATAGYCLAAVHVNALVSPFVATGSKARDLHLHRSRFDAAALQPNNQLSEGVKISFEKEFYGMETIAVDNAGGVMYAIPENGWLTRLYHNGSLPQRLMHVGGRTLGLAVHPTKRGTIIACDVAKGLISIDYLRRSIEVLSTIDDGPAARPINFPDGLAITIDGRHVFFTDATYMRPYMRHDGHWTPWELSGLDFYRGYGSGRLLYYDAETKRTQSLADGLYFPNGVALSRDESFLVVAETFNARLLRYWLSGPRKGTWEPFADVPCTPDGASTSTVDGAFYIACPELISPTLAVAAAFPRIRALLSRLPSFLWPAPGRPYGLVLKLHPNNGSIAESYHDTTGEAVNRITAVNELVVHRREEKGGGGAHGSGVERVLYLGRVQGAGLAVVRMPA